jgi:hypothetical protein
VWKSTSDVASMAWKFHAIELLQLRSCVCAMAWRFHAIDATSAP